MRISTTWAEPASSPSAQPTPRTPPPSRGASPASLDGPELAERIGTEDVGASFPDLLLDALPDPGYDPGGYGIGPVTLSRTLSGDERIDLGGRVLTVLHLPGHTPGSVALLEERTGTLYSGDAVYDGYLIDDLPESDVADYRRTAAFLMRPRRPRRPPRPRAELRPRPAGRGDGALPAPQRARGPRLSGAPVCRCAECASGARPRGPGFRAVAG